MQFSSISHGIYALTKKIEFEIKFEMSKLRSIESLMSWMNDTDGTRLRWILELVSLGTLLGTNICLRTPVAAPEATKTDGDSETTSGAAIEDQTGEVDSKNASNEDETADKSTDEAAKPAEVPESPIDMDTNLSFPKHEQKTLVEPQKGKEDVLEDDGVHVEGGDEDSVIY